jgi:hypothetical protein
VATAGPLRAATGAALAEIVLQPGLAEAAEAVRLVILMPTVAPQVTLMAEAAVV